MQKQKESVFIHQAMSFNNRILNS